MRLCNSCGGTAVADDWTCARCGYAPPRVGGFRAFAPALANGFEDYEKESYSPLSELESSSFWFRGRNALILWALARYFPDARSFLEIGCGTGFVLSGIRAAHPRMTLTATELLVAGMDFAAARVPDAELLQADARRLPFDEEFDVAGAFDVIEHVDEDETVLREMFRATRRGGGIILTVPQHRALWSVADDLAHHKRRYTRRELIEKVRAAGFTVHRVTSFVSLLMPAMLLARRRSAPASYDARAEHAFSRPVDALLNAAMALERSAIRAGVSFPFGGSLLLVARRS
ncbi:MAG TPA: class I SAM-dependent methyltransferase [Thermoanaerobaculia bacterium]|nr:class I SAM-dependent methyltransferase [Thermoanaerobaculia bacterium]